MWIKTTKTTANGDPRPRALNRPALSKRVVFSDNCKANVPEADAEFLIAEYDHIDAVESENAYIESDADSDTTTSDDDEPHRTRS